MSTSDPVASHAASPTVVPALYVARRALLFAVDAGETGPALTRWGQGLRAQFPALRGVVIMSPHWMARTPQVMTGPQPATWHDFGGFPPALYQLQYPRPVPRRWRRKCWPCCRLRTCPPKAMHRPLDHGAWVPLMHLFPEADLPVVQVALPVGGPAEVYAMGAALRDLRSQGVLVMGRAA